MRYFCTYFDKNYVARGLALYASLKRHCPEFQLDILCLDDDCRKSLARLSLPECRISSLLDLETADKDLLSAKATRTTLEYYFTITPSLIRYLLGKIPDGELLTYLDSDLYFYSDPEPLFTELQNGSIGIIAHRFPKTLEYMNRYGIFNVGWVTFRNDNQGSECAERWRQCCLRWCHNRIEGDLYADQGYLNDWPSRFTSTVVIQHLGANVAPWNVGQYAIAKESSGVTINGQPLLFYHYHALRRITAHHFDSGLSQYAVHVNEEIRQHIYKPYLDELCLIDRTLGSHEPLDSHASSERCFDLIPRNRKPDSEASMIEHAHVEDYLYRQLLLAEEYRHSREATISALSLEFFDKHDCHCGPEASAALREFGTILKQRDAALRERDAALRERESIIGVLQSRDRELTRRLARLEHELAGIKDSLSWKITTPLRNFGNLIRFESSSQSRTSSLMNK